MFKLFRYASLASLLTALSFGQQPVSRQYTVSTLPSASSNNGIAAIVRDGANALDCSTGGGLLVVTCVSNGTTWQAQSMSAAASSTLLINNAGTTGTTIFKLAKPTGAPSTAVITTTSDTSGSLGVVIAGAGTTGAATIQTYGITTLVFDGGTTAGDYVTISSTTAGAGHDAGNTFPLSGQVIGRVLSTNASGGTYQVYVFPTEVRGFGSGTAIKLLASTTVTPTAIPDGTCALQSSTITLSGAATGDPVSIGFSPALATGVNSFGQVTSANTIGINICNFTGVSATPSSSTVTATIIH